VSAVRHPYQTWMLTGILLTALCSCDRPQVHTERFLAFGTIIELSMHTDDARIARQAQELVQTELSRMHRDWHAWNPSLLTATNTKLQSQLPFEGDPEIVELITVAQEFYHQSNGLFDPGLGSLIAQWGFHSDEPGEHVSVTPQSVITWLEHPPSIKDIKIENGQLRGTHPHLRLDFGGLAKGYALEKIAKQLVLLGAQNFILNAGGDLVARGQHPERNWRIGARGPNNKKAPTRLIVFDGEGVFSSGDYERFYQQNGEHIHHIIDPETGRPATGARAVTVIHNNAARADAAATAANRSANAD